MSLSAVIFDQDGMLVESETFEQEGPQDHLLGSKNVEIVPAGTN